MSNDVSKFVIDNTEINVKDQTARSDASTAVNKATEALELAEYIESLARIVVTYSSATETITFSNETHEQPVNNGGVNNG